MWIGLQLSQYKFAIFSIRHVLSTLTGANNSNKSIGRILSSNWIEFWISPVDRSLLARVSLRRLVGYYSHETSVSLAVAADVVASIFHFQFLNIFVFHIFSFGFGFTFVSIRRSYWVVGVFCCNFNYAFIWKHIHFVFVYISFDFVLVGGAYFEVVFSLPLSLL